MGTAIVKKILGLQNEMEVDQKVRLGVMCPNDCLIISFYFYDRTPDKA